MTVQAPVDMITSQINDRRVAFPQPSTAEFNPPTTQASQEIRACCVPALQCGLVTHKYHKTACMRPLTGFMSLLFTLIG